MKSSKKKKAKGCCRAAACCSGRALAIAGPTCSLEARAHQHLVLPGLQCGHCCGGFSVAAALFLHFLLLCSSSGSQGLFSLWEGARGVRMGALEQTRLLPSRRQPLSAYAFERLPGETQGVAR